MRYSNQLSTVEETTGTSSRQQAWSLAAAIAALLLGLLLATGCNKAKTPDPGAEDPLSTSNPPPFGSGNDTGFNNTPSGGGNDGSDSVGLDIELLEVTEKTSVDFTYRNGREAGNNSILESLGGGVAILDFDRDGMLDLFLPGGGRYQDKEITGLSAGLFRNLGEWKFDRVSTEARIT